MSKKHHHQKKHVHIHHVAPEPAKPDAAKPVCACASPAPTPQRSELTRQPETPIPVIHATAPVIVKVQVPKTFWQKCKEYFWQSNVLIILALGAMTLLMTGCLVGWGHGWHGGGFHHR
jgi:hypothetical protein